MDASVLTEEIKKANNPGFTDFGSGSVVTLASQCLRCRKTYTPCTICIDFCPVDAIDTGSGVHPRITATCLRCGACIGACPANAIGCSSHNIQYFKREALKATLRVKHLAVTCERTLGLLRLESKTDAPEIALRSMRLIEESRSSDHLVVMPCLAMIPKEMWFSVLSEIGTLRFKELSIFLPVGQCEACPANAKNNIEELFSKEIGEAELWAGHSVGIITEADDLPQQRTSNVRAYLTGDLRMDRRGAFTGFLGELKKTWEENADIGNQSLNEIQVQRERKESFERTLLSADIKMKKPAGQSAVTTPSRLAFAEALGRHPGKAERVKLLVSTTDGSRCTHCGVCANACPVRARMLYDTDADNVEIASLQLKVPQKKQLDEYPENKDLQDEDRQDEAQQEKTSLLVINQLYCVACSACMQACPNEACFFTEIDGSVFLVKEPEVTTEDDS